MKKLLIGTVFYLSLLSTANAQVDSEGYLTCFSPESWGDRWYQIRCPVVSIPVIRPGWCEGKFIVDLDQIPGGLDSPPAWFVNPVPGSIPNPYTVFSNNMQPLDRAGYEPTQFLIIRTEGPDCQDLNIQYRIKLRVRGQQ